MDSAFIGLYAFIFTAFAIGAVLLYLLYTAASRYAPKARGFIKTQSGEPSEVDLRLTYKRFKELYPYSTISYQEYKKLQMARAFRRSVSSEENKRMVR